MGLHRRASHPGGPRCSPERVWLRIPLSRARRGFATTRRAGGPPGGLSRSGARIRSEAASPPRSLRRVGRSPPLRSRRGRRRPRVRHRLGGSRRDPHAPGRLEPIEWTRHTGDRVLPRIHVVAVELPVVVRLDRLRPDVDRGTPHLPPRPGRARRPPVAERRGPTGNPDRRARRGHPPTRRGVARRSLPRWPGRLAGRRTGRSRRSRCHRSGRRRGTTSDRTCRSGRARTIQREDARRRRRPRRSLRPRRGEPRTFRRGGATRFAACGDRLDGPRRRARRSTVAGCAPALRGQRRPR
jgi:hypothetical protein